MPLPLSGAYRTSHTMMFMRLHYVKICRSGNPGYMTGLPLLAGSLETSGAYTSFGPYGCDHGVRNCKQVADGGFARRALPPSLQNGIAAITSAYKKKRVH